MTLESSVLYLGSPYWCRYLRDLLSDYADLRGFTARQFGQWITTPRRRVCLVGLGPPDTAKRGVYYAATLLLRGLRMSETTVIYWIGSDVLRLKPGSRAVSRCKNLAGSSWLADEVAALGYPCRPCLFPVRLKHITMSPMPEINRLQVLCYIPDEYHSVHGGEELMRVTPLCPSIDFRILGGKGAWWPNPPANVSFLGWSDDMAGQLADSHVVLRRTPHDSFSAFVREGLVSGRHVIFTYDMPGVTHVKSGDTAGLKNALDRLDSALQSGTLMHNELSHEIRDEILDTRAQAVALANELR